MKGHIMKNLNKFNEMINKIDSQLYEINKIIKQYDSSVKTDDLLNEILDQIESNVSFQVKNKDLLKVIKVKNYILK
jgi:hypothetical protein